MSEFRALSIGAAGNSAIDLEASESTGWADCLYLKPTRGIQHMDIAQIQSMDVDCEKYNAIILWHQNVSPQTKVILEKFFVRNPDVIIIGNSHGYNQSVTELADYYRLDVPSVFMDYYSMWGPYFTDRWEECYGRSARKDHICSLGSLRHDYLFRNYRWDPNKTNGRVLVIHEPTTEECEGSVSSIGSNELSSKILESLDKRGIPFDFKVHPNWPDFISNDGKSMWSPPESASIVDIPILDILKYDAVISTWSSVIFECVALGVPNINIQYDYPTANQAEWGPGRYNLVPTWQPNEIEKALGTKQSIDSKLVSYFLGDLGRVSENYRSFLEYVDVEPVIKRMRQARRDAGQRATQLL